MVGRDYAIVVENENNNRLLLFITFRLFFSFIFHFKEQGVIVKTLITVVLRIKSSKMKRFFLFILPVLIASSCNTKKTGENKKNDTDSSTSISTDTSGTANSGNDPEKLKEALEKLTPLTTDALKALLPETLMGGKHAGISTNDAIGTMTATASYPVNDSTKITIDLYDCGGPGGAGFFGMQYSSMEEESGADEETTFKKVEFNGHKASESCMKSRPQDCTFTYFNGNRFFIMLQGEGTGIDLLKQAANELKVK